MTVDNWLTNDRDRCDNLQSTIRATVVDWRYRRSNWRLKPSSGEVASSCLCAVKSLTGGGGLPHAAEVCPARKFLPSRSAAFLKSHHR